MSRGKRKRKAQNLKRRRRRYEVLRRQIFSGELPRMPDDCLHIAWNALKGLTVKR